MVIQIVAATIGALCAIVGRRRRWSFGTVIAVSLLVYVPVAVALLMLGVR